MILVGIDVAKDKHDCFIQTADGKVLHKAFSFANNYEGFEELYAKILSCNDADVRVGLEATGHYSSRLFVEQGVADFCFQSSPDQSIPQKSFPAQDQDRQG